MGKLSNIKPMLGTIAPRLHPPPKVADRFYLSREWRALVARLKRERGNWCEQCGSSHRIIGDHIVERRDGGADLDPANVMLLCFTCHQRKTALARARRARGQIG
ncbi:HNH endonuclease [Rhodoligotrophos defluvii]|uniref:HNH endonuclease n=1 Tax=Rhodoligotrophos defluvii TaxID=2561934 RepID=UPI0010C9F17F|nr:HNH endonuclease signature motif containing protein [Rhodoligotrophos defluvii]